MNDGETIHDMSRLMSRARDSGQPEKSYLQIAVSRIASMRRKIDALRSENNRLRDSLEAVRRVNDTLRRLAAGDSVSAEERSRAIIDMMTRDSAAQEVIRLRTALMWLLDSPASDPSPHGTVLVEVLASQWALLQQAFAS